MAEQMQGLKFRNNRGQLRLVKLSYINEYSNNPCEIVFGKSVAYVSLYFIYSLLYFLIFPAFVTYHMSYKIFSMLAILIPFLFATSFLGQAMITFCKKREDSLFILIISSVPFIFLPGFVWPHESIPTFLNVIAKIIPTTSAIDGLVKINQMSADFLYVSSDCLMLICLCIIYFIFAVAALNKLTMKSY